MAADDRRKKESMLVCGHLRPSAAICGSIQPASWGRRIHILLIGFALAILLDPQFVAAQARDSTAADSLSFSVGELYAAFGLTMSEDDAYRITKSLTTFVVRDKGIEIRKTDGRKLSEDILVMLWLVSDSTAAKTNAARRAGRPSLTPEEDKRWTEKVESMRKLATGKSP
jgi:hypothetical protein